MKVEIEDFLFKNSDLEKLVRNLKGLYWAMEEPDQEWSARFLSEWGALETVLALKFDEEESADVIEEVKGVAGGRMSDFVNETVHKLNCIVGE